MQNYAAPRGGAASARRAEYDDQGQDYELRGGHHYARQDAEEEYAYDPRAYAPNPDEPYGYDQDGNPVYYEPEDEPQPLRSRSNGVAVIGAVLAVALLGGAGAVAYKMMGGSSNGEPPLIRADTEPVKTTPAATSEPQGQTKAVYDRVDQSGQKSRVVSREEEPVDLPASPGGAPRAEGSRIILPGGPASAENVAPAGDEPRRVKTMMIRPDANLAAVEPIKAPEAQRSDPIAEMARTGEPPRASEFDNGIMADAPAAKPAPQAPAAQAAAPKPQPAPQRSAAQPAQTAAVQQPAAPARQPAPAAPAPARTDPQQVAAVAPRAAVPATTPQPSRAASGGFVVQVTSQRSEAEARTAYAALQKRFPQVLGQYQASVQTATVGDRGTYYRVRVGPFGSSSDASTVCNNLRAAGGDCVVSRN